MSNKNIVGIDLFKLIASILVILLHCIGDDLGEIGSIIRNNICTIAVPYFFITSGDFFGIGLNKNKYKEKEYFINYEKKIVKMYIVWSIIGIPFMVKLYYELYNGNIPYIFLLMIRNVLFTGTFGVYWYILAMIGAVALIYLFVKDNKLKLMYIFSFVFFIFGVIYAGFQNLLGSNIIFHYLFKITWILFSCERNFLMVGWFYMSIGYYFSTHKVSIKLPMLILLFFIFTVFKFGEYYINKSGIIGDNNIIIIQSLQASTFFLIALNLKINQIQAYSKSIRELSSTIYFTHFLFIDIIDPTQKGSTIFTFTVVLALCIIFYFIIKKLDNKKLNILINAS